MTKHARRSTSVHDPLHHRRYERAASESEHARRSLWLRQRLRRAVRVSRVERINRAVQELHERQERPRQVEATVNQLPTTRLRGDLGMFELGPHFVAHSLPVLDSWIQLYRWTCPPKVYLTKSQKSRICPFFESLIYLYPAPVVNVEPILQGKIYPSTSLTVALEPRSLDASIRDNLSSVVESKVHQPFACYIFLTLP